MIKRNQLFLLSSGKTQFDRQKPEHSVNLFFTNNLSLMPHMPRHAKTPPIGYFPMSVHVLFQSG